MSPRGWLKWLAIAACWTFYGLFAASQTYLSRAYQSQTPMPWRPALEFALLDSWIWAALTPLVFWLGVRLAIRARNWWWTTPLQLVAGITFAVLHLLVFVQLLPFIGYVAPARGPGLFQTLMMAKFHSNLLTYVVLVGAGHGLDYYRQFRERELRATQLEARLSEAQLQVLKMQLHPHFLFNTLHAISALMYQDVEAADRMISRLSDLLRLTLESSGVQEVPLKQELEYLARYLEIEQIRFGERLRVRMDIEPETLDARLPNLILQPLVENAIRHGIGPRSAGGLIEVQARIEDRTLALEILDDGPGVAVAPPVEGVGLANTRARLEQLYGGEQRFEAGNSVRGGFQVRLVVPLHTGDAQ